MANALRMMMATDAAVERLVTAARDLASEDGENGEYDRALVELVGYATGLGADEHRDEIAAVVLHKPERAIRHYVVTRVEWTDVEAPDEDRAREIATFDTVLSDWETSSMTVELA